MSHVVAVFITFLLTVLFCSKLQLDEDRSNVATGVIIVDKQAYRLAPLNLQ